MTGNRFIARKRNKTESVNSFGFANDRSTKYLCQILPTFMSEQLSVESNLFTFNFNESLILAQDERWRRALYMQVTRSCLAIAQHSLNVNIKNQNAK